MHSSITYRRYWLPIAAALALAAGCGGSSSGFKSSDEAGDPGAGTSLPGPPPGGGGGTAGRSAAGGSGGAAGSGPVAPVPSGARDGGASFAGDAGGAGNTNIALGGSQDFGYYRSLLNAG